MILLTLNNIVNTSLVSEINKCLESSFLKDSIFVKVDCTLEEFNKIDLSYVDFVFIDCSDFSMENYSLFKHRLFNYQKFVYLYNTDDFYANYLEDMKESNVYKFIIERDKILDFNYLSGALDIVKDFYGETVNKRKFCNSNFSINVCINGKGEFIVPNIEAPRMFKMDEFRRFELDTIKKLKLETFDNPFDPYLYNPWAFVIGVTDKDVIEYKIKVFNKLKELSSKDLLSMDLNVKKFILNRPYVRLSDVSSIISEEDEFLWI